MQVNSRRLWLFGGVAVVAAAAGMGGAWWQQRRSVSGAGAGEVLGTDFWAQRFEQPEGGELLMSSLQGRPLLINFWATWCPPCVEELPMLDRFFSEQGAHGSNGFQVLGLAIDQPSAVRKFLARTPVKFPNGMAGLQGTEMVKRLGNAAGGLPFTLVLDRVGQVVARKMGRLDPSDLEGWGRALIRG